jgi:phosphohistidine phosphatase
VKTLLLLRHAKSSWDDSTLRDHERPLAPRGERAAPAMGRYLDQERLVPERVVCSTSARTRQTWGLLERELDTSSIPGSIAVEFSHLLYGASAGEMLEEIHAQPTEVDRLLLVGHNPGTEELALALAGDGSDAGARARIGTKFPTAGLAVLEAPVEAWTGFEPGKARLLRFVVPKDLPEAERDRL